MGEIQPTDYHYASSSTVLRAAMEKLQLELINRDYFDPKSLAVPFTQHKLELWPGYVTSIRQHEQKMLLAARSGTRSCRTDTVLNQMEEIVKRGGANAAPRATSRKALRTPLDDSCYNNKTYRIDEIVRTKHPDDEF